MRQRVKVFVSYELKKTAKGRKGVEQEMELQNERNVGSSGAVGPSFRAFRS